MYCVVVYSQKRWPRVSSIFFRVSDLVRITRWSLCVVTFNHSMQCCAILVTAPNPAGEFWETCGALSNRRSGNGYALPILYPTRRLRRLVLGACGSSVSLMWLIRFLLRITRIRTALWRLRFEHDWLSPTVCNTAPCLPLFRSKLGRLRCICLLFLYSDAWQLPYSKRFCFLSYVLWLFTNSFFTLIFQ